MHNGATTGGVQPYREGKSSYTPSHKVRPCPATPSDMSACQTCVRPRRHKLYARRRLLRRIGREAHSRTTPELRFRLIRVEELCEFFLSGHDVTPAPLRPLCRLRRYERRRSRWRRTSFAVRLDR